VNEPLYIRLEALKRLEIPRKKHRIPERFGKLSAIIELRVDVPESGCFVQEFKASLQKFLWNFAAARQL
jgi:hypothetical protein